MYESELQKKFTKIKYLRIFANFVGTLSQLLTARVLKTVLNDWLVHSSTLRIKKKYTLFKCFLISTCGTFSMSILRYRSMHIAQSININMWYFLKNRETVDLYIEIFAIAFALNPCGSLQFISAFYIYFESNLKFIL